MPSISSEPPEGSEPPATRTPERRGGEGEGAVAKSPEGIGSGGGSACARREHSGAEGGAGAFPAGGAQDPLGGLSALASGCLLTLALGGGAGGEGAGEVRALGSLAEPDAAACRAGLAALGAMDRGDRARVIAGLLRRARAPVPDGIENVHPGWLRAVLEGEATPILRALIDGLPPEIGAVAREIIEARGDGDAPESTRAIAEEPLAELRRAAFSSLVPMPRRADAERADAPPWVRLAVMPFPALLVEIERRGAATLGTSLAGAPPAVVARAAAAAGSALAPLVLEGSRRSPPAEERQQARALVAAGVSEASVGSMTIVGLLALASELAPGAVRVIAQRLPPRLGRLLISPSS